jgi:hypothetical protein
MMKGAQTALVLLLLGLTGCATTQLHFTSEPSGATVATKTRHYWRSLRLVETWDPQGTTPCTVKVWSRYGPDEARLSLDTNQSRVVVLLPFGHHGIVRGSAMGYGCGAQGAAGAAIAYPPAALVCVGCLGLWTVTAMAVDRGTDYTQTDFHVLFGAGDCGWTSIHAEQYVPLPDRVNPPDKPDCCRVYVLRPMSGDKGAPSGNIEVFDGLKAIGRTGKGSYLCWERQAGKTTITGVTGNTSSLELVVEKGRVYYVMQDAWQGFFNTRNSMKLVDETEGLAALRQCAAPAVKPPLH